jgi:hypothetical protein
MRRHALRAARRSRWCKALVLEAALLIAVTMLLADLLRARIDPRAGARS